MFCGKIGQKMKDAKIPMKDVLPNIYKKPQSM